MGPASFYRIPDGGDAPTARDWGEVIGMIINTHYQRKKLR